MASFNFTSVVLNEGTMFHSAPGSALPTVVVASTTTLLKPGSRRHLLQHPAATLTASLMISVKLDFLI
jgi:hypothetical protein